MAQRTSFNLTRAQILALDSLSLAVGCINHSRVSARPVANKTALLRLVADKSDDPRLVKLLQELNKE